MNDLASLPLVETRKIGGLTVHAIQAGIQRLDGGAMFGVVPRTLWERKIAPDANPEGKLWVPGDAPSIVCEWAVKCVAKAGTIGIIGVYPENDKFFPIGASGEPGSKSTTPTGRHSTSRPA